MRSAAQRAARHFRSLLQSDRVSPAAFGAALAEISPEDRDEWLDLLWDIGEIPDDAADLPRGCVPYLPCPVEAVLEAVQQVGVTHDDVFVDVGSGAGRVASLVHLLTGAGCIGLEIQPHLVRAAQARADWLKLDRARFIEGDAADLVRFMTTGRVFFLYCPFGGDRLRKALDGLAEVARTRPIRVCCVDMPRLDLPWLAPLPGASSHVDSYRSIPTRGDGYCDSSMGP